MKRFFATLVLIATYSAFPANAATVTCPTVGTYDTLMGLNSAGGCTIDNLVFSNFTFASTQTNGAAAVTAGDLVISSIIDSVPASVGFAFADIPITAGAGQTSDVVVTYTVSAESGAPTITGAALSEVGRAVPDTGVATIDEALCTDPLAPACPAADSFGLHTSFNSTVIQKPVDSVDFAGVTGIAVTDHLHAAGGIVGSGEITGFSNTFTDTPEPTTLLLIGFGLLVIMAVQARDAFLRRRRSH
jgi:hypothetical protein